MKNKFLLYIMFNMEIFECVLGTVGTCHFVIFKLYVVRETKKYCIFFSYTNFSL